MSLFESLLHVLYDNTLPSFFFLFFSSLFFFFLSCFFFLMLCLLMFTRFQFYFPFVLTFLLFLLHKFFPMVTFPHFRLVYHSIVFLFNSINLLFTWARSIQFSSYFVINVMLFDFALTCQIFTVVPNFRTYRIYICINLLF